MPKAALSFSFILVPMLLPLPARAQLSLGLIEKLVQNKFLIAHITWQELQQKITSSDSSHYLLFDTRAQEEYQTSHIRSALRLEPQMPVTEFIKIYGDTLNGKHAVFYCSVGYRSSIFAERAQQQTLQAGALSVANLRGGIFRWYNEGNPVVDAHGETNEIHPYDPFWGVLVRERKKNKNEELMTKP